MYGILGIIGFSAYPDEFGYWSVAAAILGYDWSEITGLGPYYSYGYSILLTPVLFFFHDPIITYRMAIVLNLLLQCASFPLLFAILKELFPEEKKNALALSVVIAVLYPAWSFYIQTTMAEAVLYFGFIVAIYLMMRFLKKPSVITGIFPVIFAVYLYLVHMRCIGVIGAVAITVLIRITAGHKSGEKKNRRTWLILVLAVFLFVITFLLKDKVVALLYHSTSKDMLSWNDYSGLSYRFGKLLSLNGMVYLFKDFCGKVLYLGLATYGIAYYGVFVIVKRAFSGFKKIREKNCDDRDYLWIYICFSVIMQFWVALIYLNGASAPDADRLDNFLHGRYIDFFIPILLGVGVLSLLKTKKLLKELVIVLLVYVLLGAVAVETIVTNDVQLCNPHGFTMIGMSYLLKTPLTDTLSFFLKETAFQSALTVLTFALALAARRRGFEPLIAGMILVQIVLGLNACDHFIFPYQNYIQGDLAVGEKLGEILEKHPVRKVVHIYEGGNPYIELVQFSHRDLYISAVDAGRGCELSDYLDDDTILIIPRDSAYEEDINNYYKEKWEDGHLRLHYNP